MHFVEKNINFNKKETKLKMESPTQFWREEPRASAHIRITN